MRTVFGRRNVVALFAIAAIAVVGGSSARAGATITVCASACNYTTVAAAVAAVASSGDVIQVQAGTYASGTIEVAKSVTIQGAGVGVTTLDLSGASSYGIHVTAPNVAIEDLTVTGPPSTSAGYGLKIEGANLHSAPTGPITVSNVTVDNSARTGIDLNGIDGATLSNVTVNGDSSTHGTGIGITDSKNVTIDGATTSGNHWGGIGVYVKGAFYNCGTSGVTLTGTLSLGETNALYTGNDSGGTSCTISGLTVPGSALPYKVSLSTTDPQDIYVKSLADATAVASGTAPLVRSTSESHTFWVTSGFKVQDALNAAASGDTVEVAAGTYPETVTFQGDNVGLVTTAGAVIQPAAASARHRIVDFNNHAGITFDGFTVVGPDPTANAGVTVWGANATVQNVTVENVLTGVQTSNGVSPGATLANITATSNVGYGISLQSNGATVTGANLSTATEGIGVLDNLTGISISQSKIVSAGTALKVYAHGGGGSIDAADNWWGSAAGPGTLAGVTTSPWYTDSSLSTLSNASGGGGGAGTGGGGAPAVTTTAVTTTAAPPPAPPVVPPVNVAQSRPAAPGRSGSVSVSVAPVNTTPGATVAATVPVSVALSWSPAAFTVPVTVQVTPKPQTDTGTGGTGTDGTGTSGAVAAPTPVAGGFAVGNTVVQVSVTTAAGVPVTEFAAPLTIHVSSLPAGQVPAYSHDGTSWTTIPRLAGPELPDGQADGYFVNADGSVDILTRHATLFGLLLDTQAPARPVVQARLTGSRLRLLVRSRDNVRLASYRVSLNGKLIRRTTHAYLVLAARAGSFQVVAVDTAGNRSKASSVIVVTKTHAKHQRYTLAG
jgi:hypothetical protein